MRIGFHSIGGVFDAHFMQRIGGDLAGLAVMHPLVQQHRLDDLLAHGIDRIERRHRLLKDHGNLRAADP